uniref:NADH-ubiquinone oxidoreductase chain 4 n=1 Tax=Phakopsora meibomiae TaxID=169999 RepID=D8V188_9BASI|nr:NADH dehydrogenase subunit 4 [Phakopsora meibomiae]ACT36173.1 NADH dehydrogenase subunit 4 [Phakopsora meibomiae]
MFVVYSIVIIPFIGAIHVSLTEGKNVGGIRRLSLIYTCITYYISIMIWIEFDASKVGIQIVSRFSDWEMFNIAFGVDGLSVFFVILTALTIPIAVISGYYIENKDQKLYLSLILIFSGFIISVFISLDLIIFYVSFEAVLVPLTLLVGIYGGRRRISAAYILFLYTLFGSLPMLLSFLSMYTITKTTNIVVLSIMSYDYHNLIWLGIFIGLAVKTPLVPFHLWLKTAHAEANCAVSVVLAGLVLKLATYAHIRVLIQLIPEQTQYFQSLVLVISIISIIYTAFICIRQTDFKQLVAYSSINHIGIVCLGIYSNTVTGIEGGIILSISHGVVSPALFILVGGVIYDRYHDRTIRYYRGLVTYIPLFSIFFLIFTLGNMATPLTGNWVGEFISLAGAFQTFPLITILASSSIVISACYSIYLYNRICFGSWSRYLNPVIDITRLEFHVLIPLLILIIALGIYPNIVLDYLHVSCSSLIY